MTSTPKEPRDVEIRILLVDDEPRGLLALETILAPLGVTTEKASSGREALRKVLSNDYALILLDVQMPDMDGFETAELIRERERSRATPILFLTAAMKSDEAVFKGYSVGAVDYMTKPFIPEILRSKVAVFVELARKSARLAALNLELDAQAEELRLANWELELFSHTASHDLGAPIRHIEGFGRALREALGPGAPAEALEYLGDIDAAARRMKALIADLLALSRVTKVELRHMDLDLASIATRVLDTLRRGEPGREVDFRIESPLPVRGDPSLLGVAIENLVGNAWKYTGKKAHARVEVGSVVLEGGARAYFVKDDGAGFDAARARDLFMPFRRFHAASEFPGTGVGLATVERIVRRHGGQIWAESAPGEGATFYFTLGEES